MMSKRSLRRLKYFSPFLPTVTSFTFTPSFCSSAFLFSACEHQSELRVSTYQMTKSVLLCDAALHLVNAIYMLGHKRANLKIQKRAIGAHLLYDKVVVTTAKTTVASHNDKENGLHWSDVDQR